MEKRLIFQCSKKEGEKPELWFYIVFSIIGFFMFSSLLFKGGFVVLLIYIIYKMNEKSEGKIYNTGFEIIEDGKKTEIEFDKVLYFTACTNQSMSIEYLDNPVINYTKDEIKKMLSDGNYNRILFEDAGLRDNFKYVFDTAEREFCNYILNVYNNDIEEIEKSIFLSDQIQNGVLENNIISKISVNLMDNKTVEVSEKKKLYMKFGRLAQKIGELTSYEPRWRFVETNQKVDTMEITNREIVREILEKKYKIQFIKKGN